MFLEVLLFVNSLYCCGNAGNIDDIMHFLKFNYVSIIGSIFQNEHSLAYHVYDKKNFSPPLKKLSSIKGLFYSRENTHSLMLILDYFIFLSSSIYFFWHIKVYLRLICTKTAFYFSDFLCRFL